MHREYEGHGSIENIKVMWHRVYKGHGAWGV